MGGPALIDLEIDSATDTEVRARVAVNDACKQPLGLVHGGVFAVMAEEMTADGGRVIANQTSFLRPVTEGVIHAVARRRHRGRTTAVWEVDVADDLGRLCAVVRVTVAVWGGRLRRAGLGSAEPALHGRANHKRTARGAEPITNDRLSWRKGGGA